MGQIHYFQRYSSRENAVTNNTLQLFARIYEQSPDQLANLLTEITGENIEIGIDISQQQRSGDSVPDGIIGQRSFKILIETKVDAGIDESQLVRHASQFKGEDQKILLLLTKEKVESGNLRSIESKIKESNPGVIFSNTTFEDICSKSKTLFKEHETHINAIIEDYWQYCNDSELFDQAIYLMRVLPCSVSLELNAKYGIYYHGSDRGYTNHRYLGIYANKSVRYIWEIESVFDVTWNKSELTKQLVTGTDTNKFDERIIGIIEESKSVCGYYTDKGHRFFCGEPVETDFRKVSPGGIQGAKLFNLKELIGEPTSIQIAAKNLSQLTWD
ncbi:MAG: hypothetical protein VST71_04955 [Nitrospirota bacterium]|nr:hypothetical protein [Nitrospirota bacterium]